ncbi:MAG TPA: hypothetical protein VHE34_27805 [Puia sp.]|uniref:hypothetical protein n=1 Tax=Puia sp. TaxID=2045100 RepID=UPI002CFD34A6|nr:hypothetical protein [Puia sp.]HVU99071.1 hypothetical protein [Puia sp.]
MGKNLHKFSFYALILAVYGVFFSVESFYNFEGHSEAREIIRYSAFLHARSGEPGLNAPRVHYPGSHRTKLRLNKRYHGEEFAPCTVYEAPAPAVIVTPRELGVFCLRPLPSVSLIRPQLRGPPLAV